MYMTVAPGSRRQSRGRPALANLDLQQRRRIYLFAELAAGGSPSGLLARCRRYKILNPTTDNGKPRTED